MEILERVGLSTSAAQQRFAHSSNAHRCYRGQRNLFNISLLPPTAQPEAGSMLGRVEGIIASLSSLPWEGSFTTTVSNRGCRLLGRITAFSRVHQHQLQREVDRIRTLGGNVSQKFAQSSFEWEYEHGQTTSFPMEG